MCVQWMLYIVRKMAEGSAGGAEKEGRETEEGEIIAEQAVGRRPRSYYEVFMTSPEMGDARREFKDREADCIPMLVFGKILPLVATRLQKCWSCTKN